MLQSGTEPADRLLLSSKTRCLNCFFPREISTFIWQPQNGRKISVLSRNKYQLQTIYSESANRLRANGSFTSAVSLIYLEKT
jgi:hypothetical protein